MALTVLDFAGLVGVQTLLAGLFAWLGKVSGERIARAEQAELDRRLKTLEANLSATTHVTIQQFNHELACYRDLWKNAQAVVDSVTIWPRKRDTATGVVDELIQYREQIAINRPFFPMDIYEHTQTLMELVQGGMKSPSELSGKPDELRAWHSRQLSVIQKCHEKLHDAIRTRLATLKTVT
jgi:hypothetical protein